VREAESWSQFWNHARNYSPHNAYLSAY
jgi:hypothetical protein